MLLILSLVVLSGCGGNPDSQDYLSANVKLYKPEDVNEFVRQQKLTKKQLFESIGALQKSFKSSYIGYYLKKSLIGKSSDEIFAKCRILAAQSKDQLASFELYDVILQCLAEFKDSHLDISEMLTPATLTSAVTQVQLIENKFYISAIRPNIIKKLEERQKLPADSLLNQLKVGTEIISINNNKPIEEVHNLEKYISASSAEARKHRAVDSLFYRNFNYPSASEIKLQIKLEDGSICDVTIPWLMIPNHSSLESRTLLSKQGLLKTTDLSADQKLTQAKGFDIRTPLIKNLTGLRTYQDEENDDVLVTGTATLKNKRVCYMQLNTFNINEDDDLKFKVFEKKGDQKYTLSFIGEIKNFLSACETVKAPLIFDLRNNGGGDPEVSENLYSLFESSTTPLTYSASSRLIQAGNNAFLNSFLNDVDKDKPNLERALYFTAAKNSLDKKQFATDWVLMRNNELSSKIFTGDIYLLTSNYCASACERAAHRFKLSGRAKIIGTDTNGTGFGFNFTRKGKTLFRDALNLYEIKIPNYAFQTALIKDETDFNSEANIKGSILEFNQLALMENNPTKPDIELRYTLNDIKNNFQDYTQKLAEIIFP